MNLLLDFWNSRPPTIRSRPVDRWSEPVCPSGNMYVRGTFWVKAVRVKDRSIILISRAVRSLHLSLFAPALPTFGQPFATRGIPLGGIYFKNVIHTPP